MSANFTKLLGCFYVALKLHLVFVFLYVNKAHSDLDIFSCTFVTRLQLVRTVVGLYNEIHIWPILGHMGLSAHNCVKTSTYIIMAFFKPDTAMLKTLPPLDFCTVIVHEIIL